MEISITRFTIGTNLNGELIMGSKRSEPKPPKFQPVMMDAQGNFYRENPEWRKKMEKFRTPSFWTYGLSFKQRAKVA